MMVVMPANTIIWEAPLGVDDIPAQVGRVIRFSVRSPSSFFLSLVTSMFVVGFAADLFYGFLYTRIYNVKDASYTPFAWVFLSLLALGLPLLSGLYALASAYRKLWPFGAAKYGVAITPFDVFSLDPDVLGTPSKKQALEEVIPQFFNAMLARFHESEWYNWLEFRYLPPFVRINTQADAQTKRAKLRAELMIWGKIVQKFGDPLSIEINLAGLETNLKFTGPADPLRMADIFSFFILGSTGYSLMKSGHAEPAIRLLKEAQKFAPELDKTTNSGTNHANMIAGWLREAEQGAHQRAEPIEQAVGT
jgi:hypothetical protein